MSDAQSQAADDRDEDEEAAEKMYGHLSDEELKKASLDTWRAWFQAKRNVADAHKRLKEAECRLGLTEIEYNRRRKD